MGRPTKYTPEVVEAAKAYIEQYKEHGHAIPSIVGMAVVLNLAESTLYAWGDDEEKEFSGILAKCLSHQHFALVNGGLKSELNSNITKLVLGKHGYSDKSDINGDLSVGAYELTDTERNQRIATLFNAAADERARQSANGSEVDASEGAAE